MEPRPPLLDSLRRHTRAEHHGLENHPVMTRLVRPGLHIEDYAETLSALHPAQQELEQLAATTIDHLTMTYPLAPRVAWLEADLAHLGLSPPNPQGRDPELPATLPELVGLLYVLEGARLGARVIADKIHVSLGDATPMAFFDHADGERAWPTFCDFAVKHCPMDEAGLAIRAARRAFGHFRKHIDCPPALDWSPIAWS